MESLNKRRLSVSLLKLVTDSPISKDPLLRVFFYARFYVRPPHWLIAPTLSVPPQAQGSPRSWDDQAAVPYRSGCSCFPPAMDRLPELLLPLPHRWRPDCRIPGRAPLR